MGKSLNDQKQNDETYQKCYKQSRPGKGDEREKLLKAIMKLCKSRNVPIDVLCFGTINIKESDDNVVQHDWFWNDLAQEYPLEKKGLRTKITMKSLRRQTRRLARDTFGTASISRVIKAIIEKQVHRSMKRKDLQNSIKAHYGVKKINGLKKIMTELIKTAEGKKGNAPSKFYPFQQSHEKIVSIVSREKVKMDNDGESRRNDVVIQKGTPFLIKERTQEEELQSLSSLFPAFHSTQMEKDLMDFLITPASSGERNGNTAMTKVEKLKIAKEHFQCCPLFKKTYQKIRKKNKAFKGSSYLLFSSVRHLCPNACFLRAFSPIREWHDFRKAVSQLEIGPLDIILKGWKCRLGPRVLAKSGSLSTKAGVKFYSPEGKLYNSKTSALNHLKNIYKLSTYNKHHKNNDNIEASIPPPVVSDNIIHLKIKKKKHTGKGCSIELSSDSKPNILTRRENLTLQTPFGLLEELFCDNPWRLLLSTIFLNRTSRYQVDVILYDFLRKWPTPYDVIKVASWEDISDVIRPLGLHQKRAKSLIRFSREYLECMERKTAKYVQNKNLDSKEIFDSPMMLLSEKEVLSLHQCGKYAYDAYRIFVQRRLDTAATDHALKDYIEYQQGITKRKVADPKD